MVVRTIGNQKSSIVYFEVPNVRLILERLSVWDVIYEHCSYFSRESLGRVFHNRGFNVLDVREPYDAQFLSIEATLDPQDKGTVNTFGDLTELKKLVERFSEETRAKWEHWRKKLSELQGRKVVIWGGGAKTVGFVNMLQARDQILYAVDINPHKQGMHLAGTGQRIVAPEFLKEYQPATVILMNPIYRGEVEAHLHSMDLRPELINA